MRPRSHIAAAMMSVAIVVGCASSAPSRVLQQPTRFESPIALPAPDTRGSVPLETVIGERRSRREFSAQPLPISAIGQLLWAGQGITGTGGLRAAPSAGGLYPLELYVVTPGETMHYLPAGHRIEVRPQSDLRPHLRAAALDQTAVGTAPAIIVIASQTNRTAAKYGALADAFVHLEAGHVAENILLEATALDLAATPIGGFNPRSVERVLALPPAQHVLYLLPVGFPVQ